MTKEKLLERLQSISEAQYSGRWDGEQDHIDADKLLLEYINDSEITKAFNHIHKWYA